MLREQRIVEQANLDNGPGIQIISASLKMVKTSAKITKGTFHPVMLIDHLEFQINNDEIIQDDSDIQDKGLVGEGCAQFDGIGNLHSADFFCGKTQERTDQSLQYMIVLLQEGAEKIVVGHWNGKRAGGGKWLI